VDETISVESPNNMASKSNSEGENDDDFTPVVSRRSKKNRKISYLPQNP
jgi:hypothetical protein